MDWHASVYGSRSGGGQYRDFSDGDADDDGVTYGARGSYADMADDTAGATPLPPSVDDAELRRLGGNAVYFRAKDVLKSGRMHDMAVSFNVPDSPRTSGTMLTGARANVRLTALVKGADRYADDYRVSAAIDTDAGKVASHRAHAPHTAGSGACASMSSRWSWRTTNIRMTSPRPTMVTAPRTVSVAEPQAWFPGNLPCARPARLTCSCGSRTTSAPADRRAGSSTC